MIKKVSPRQLRLDFGLPFGGHLNPENRWIKLADSIPWDELSEGYESQLTPGMGSPAKSARVAIGALIIKHKLRASDAETVEQIRENPYLQYFLGFESFVDEKVFAPSLFVEIRKRLDADAFARMEQAIVDAARKRGVMRSKNNDDEDQGGNGSPTVDGGSSLPDQDSSTQTHHGKLIVDATVAPQAIRYPTDVGLLNEGRMFTEAMIDKLHALDRSGAGKPRTYRQKARKMFLSFSRNRKPGWRKLRRAIREQLQYIRRNLGHIETLLDALEVQSGSKAFPLKASWQRKWFIVQNMYAQQDEMYRTKQRRCSDRIVSLHQPHVRPIVRGKAGTPVEFGCKINVSLVGKLAFVDELRWDAYNESEDLPSQVERYRERYGFYPEVVLADGIYGTRDNRRYLKEHGIRFGGKPLGRPKKLEGEAAVQARRQQREDEIGRIPVEGKFGQGKVAYGLGYVRARLASTSSAWVRASFLVMNILALASIVQLVLHLTGNWQRWRYRIRRSWKDFLPSMLSIWSDEICPANCERGSLSRLHSESAF